MLQVRRSYVRLAGLLRLRLGKFEEEEGTGQFSAMSTADAIMTAARTGLPALLETLGPLEIAVGKHYRSLHFAHGVFR